MRTSPHLTHARTHAQARRLAPWGPGVRRGFRQAGASPATSDTNLVTPFKLRLRTADDSLMELMDEDEHGRMFAEHMNTLDRMVANYGEDGAVVAMQEYLDTLDHDELCVFFWVTLGRLVLRERQIALLPQDVA